MNFGNSGTELIADMLFYVGRILLVQIILLLNLLANSNSYEWDRKFPEKNTVCKTVECIRHASYIAGLLNRKIKPCKDFYEYVCGNWEKKHPVPPSYPIWQVDSELEELAFHRIRKILLETPTENDSTDLKLAKQSYKDCTEIQDLGKIEGTKLRSYVEAAGHFPLVLNETANGGNSWLELHNYYLSLTGESGLFNIYTLADARLDYNSLLHVSELTSPYGMIKTRKRLSLQKEKIYRVFLATAVNRVIPPSTYNLPYLVIEKRLSEVFRFRDALMQSLLLRETGDYSIITVENLDAWYDQGVPKNAVREKVSWIDIMTSLYNNTKTRSTISNMVVNLKNKPYFRTLARLLSETPADVIVNHIHLYFIERHLELDSYLYKMLLDVIVQDGKLQGTLEYTGKRWQACISCNVMREAITKVYVKRYLPKSTREKIESMIADLQRMLILQVTDCIWLDDAAVFEVKLLINNLKLTIDFGYEESETQTTTYTMNVCISTGIVDVFYSRPLNCISISAAYFESPIYSPTFPDTLTYGSIAAIFGHEMYHALEPIFTQYSQNSKKSCCSRKVVNAYASKTKCFFIQFDKVPVKELSQIKPIPTIDGQRTLQENIADSVGLRLAYETFKNKTLEAGSCVILPNLPDLTCEQTFFISFASSFCSSIKVDKMLEDIETDEHSTPRTRVNGAVSNMPQFAKAFNCPNHSPMNPDNKCNLWE